MPVPSPRSTANSVQAIAPTVPQSETIEGPRAAALQRLAVLVRPRFLELILLPTERCNFRCVYCYEDFAIGRMKPEVVAGVKALLRNRSCDLEELNLGWFGGEPLLARDIVLDISRFALGLRETNPGLVYRGGATTNGYFLTPDLFGELVAAGVLDYQISLDGPPEIHDTRRVRADGAGTFERIWSNLLAMHASAKPFAVVLRVHFDARTVEQLDPLLVAIRRELLPDPRFKVFFKAIARLGGPNDLTLPVVPMAEQHRVIEGLNRALYGSRPPPEDDDAYVCYASRPNSMVIRADGRIGKCTVALSDVRNDVGQLRRDGTVAIDQARLAPWLRGLMTLDAETLECPLQNLPALSGP